MVKCSWLCLKKVSLCGRSRRATSSTVSPKCQHEGTDAASTDGKPKADPLDPNNIADSIKKLEDLKQTTKTDHDSFVVLDQALSILRHTESIISSIRRASVGMVSEDIEAQTMISSVEDTPKAVKEWLAATFTKQIFGRRQQLEPPKFRSIVQAVRASMYVDKITRKTSAQPDTDKSPALQMLQSEMNCWDISVFRYDKLSNHQPFRGLFAEVLQRYDLVSRFKINLYNLENYCALVESGYNLHGNPYHNATHGADVLLTTHNLISLTGFASWLTDLEILALLFSAMIHDVEHTGTTNNFHICTGSPLTMMYNDRSVLENHHISTAYKYFEQPDSNPFVNLSVDVWREMRAIVVEAVLGTDMSAHFTQIKNMQNALFNPSAIKNFPTENHCKTSKDIEAFFSVNRNTAMTLILHCADISHPCKKWELHKRWTDNLMEEFFLQGDKETALSLPNSPLCSREQTLIPESQVGFIDFIIIPSMNLLGDMFDALLLIQHDESNSSNNKTAEFKKITRPWDNRLKENRKRWKSLVKPAAAAEEPAENGKIEEAKSDKLPPLKTNSLSKNHIDTVTEQETEAPPVADHTETNGDDKSLVLEADSVHTENTTSNDNKSSEPDKNQT